MKRTFALRSTEAAERYISFLLSQGYEFHDFPPENLLNQYPVKG